MRPSFFSCRFAALAFLPILAAIPSSLAAQQGGPAKPANLFGDTGGFERSTVQDNLWDGVNGDGSLAGFTFSAQVVTERGAFAGLSMPPSVAFVDLNGDGKPDLITADPTGFFRFYPDVGTAAAPKFTSAEIIPIYLSGSSKPRQLDYHDSAGSEEMRFCPRIALADWRHTGLLDLLVGNYYGEVLFVPNSGSARQPQYRWPGSVEKLLVPTNDQGRFWANLLSPVGYDWTGHGRLDLPETVGTADTPKFSSDPAKHTYLAYGDGREQLIPTVVDYDGDGKPDLLVADRTGEVGVYLNTGKPGEELKRAATITFGNTSKLPSLTSSSGCPTATLPWRSTRARRPSRSSGRRRTSRARTGSSARSTLPTAGRPTCGPRTATRSPTPRSSTTGVIPAPTHRRVALA